MSRFGPSDAARVPRDNRIISENPRCLHTHAHTTHRARRPPTHAQPLLSEPSTHAETKAATTSLAKKAKTSGVMPQQEGEVKTCVHTDKAPAAIGPYSQATVAGKTAYISGCLGLVPGAEKPTLAEGGIEGQTRQCLENLKATVEGAGGKMINVVKTTVLLANDMSNYPTVNKIYGEYFPTNPPARAAFAVAALPAGGLIEIECICALE